MLGWRRSGRINVRRRFRHPVPIDEVSNRCLRTHLDPTFHGIRPWCKVKVGEAVAKSIGVEALEDVGYVGDEVMIFRTITGGTEDARGRIVGCTEGIIRGESRVRVKGDRHDDDVDVLVVVVVVVITTRVFVGVVPLFPRHFVPPR